MAAAAIGLRGRPGTTAAWAPGGATATVGSGRESPAGLGLGRGGQSAPPPRERRACPETGRGGGLSRTVMPQSPSALSR